MNNLRLPILVLSTLLALQSCAIFAPRLTEDELTKLTFLRGKLSYEYSAPRLVEGEMVLTISDIKAIPPDSLQRLRAKYSIPESADPRFQIWSSGIQTHKTQWLLDEPVVDLPPTVSYREIEYGNKIHYWNLPDLAPSQNEITLRRSFKYVTFDYRPEVSEEWEQNYWEMIPVAIIQRYTRSEPFLEQDDALKDTVAALLQEVENPVQKARILFDWVREHLTYVYPPEERGVRHAFSAGSGDCGQYSALFITMARIAGIPARQQSGYTIKGKGFSAHVWSEIYLPWEGWVPIDATREDGFLHLDNARLIASIGLNIPLEPVPDWASFAFSEVEDERTDFMQMFTLLKYGYTANFKTEQRVIRSVEIP